MDPQQDGTLLASDGVLEIQTLRLLQQPQNAVIDQRFFQEAVKGGYTATAAKANTVLEWLGLASDLRQGKEDDDFQNRVAEEELESLFLKSFDPARADLLLTHENAEDPVWINEMLRYPRWRNLFYKLSEKHRGCLLLSFIIHRICEMGPIQCSEVAHRAPASAAAVRTVPLFLNLFKEVMAPLCRADADEATLQRLMPAVVRLCSQNPQGYLLTLVVLARSAIEWEALAESLSSCATQHKDELGHAVKSPSVSESESDGTRPAKKRQRIAEGPDASINAGITPPAEMTPTIARAHATATRRVLEELSYYTAFTHQQESAVLPKRLALLVQWFGVPKYCTRDSIASPQHQHGFGDILTALANVLTRGETNPHDMQRLFQGYVGQADLHGPSQHQCMYMDVSAQRTREGKEPFDDRNEDDGLTPLPLLPPLRLLRTANFIEILLADLCRHSRPVAPAHRPMYLHLLAIATAAQGHVKERGGDGFDLHAGDTGPYCAEPDVIETLNTLQLHLPDLEPLIKQYPIAAAYVVEWLRNQMTDTSAGAPALSAQETPRRVHILVCVAEHHPLLRPRVIDAILAALIPPSDATPHPSLAGESSLGTSASALLQESLDDEQKDLQSTYGINVQISDDLLTLEVKQHLIRGLVELMRVGASIPALEGFLDVTTCPLHHRSLGSGSAGSRPNLPWLAHRIASRASEASFIHTPQRLLHSLPRQCRCGTNMDDSLIRFFVTQVLAMAAPPYSPAFSRAMLMLVATHYPALRAVTVSSAHTGGGASLSMPGRSAKERSRTDALLRDFRAYIRQHADELQLFGPDCRAMLQSLEKDDMST